jgi:hypothetical protein
MRPILYCRTLELSASELHERRRARVACQPSMDALAVSAEHVQRAHGIRATLGEHDLPASDVVPGRQLISLSLLLADRRSVLCSGSVALTAITTLAINATLVADIADRETFALKQRTISERCLLPDGLVREFVVAEAAVRSHGVHNHSIARSPRRDSNPRLIA